MCAHLSTPLICAFDRCRSIEISQQQQKNMNGLKTMCVWQFVRFSLICVFVRWCQLICLLSNTLHLSMCEVSVTVPECVRSSRYESERIGLLHSNVNAA